MRVIIIGGVAAGMSAAAKLKRIYQIAKQIQTVWMDVLSVIPQNVAVGAIVRGKRHDSSWQPPR